jgi:AGCS family alanine or glycine:cation symporter
MQKNNLIAGVGALGLMLLSGQALASSIDETVNGLFASATGWFVNFIFSPFPGTSFPWIVAWLVVAATIFTFYFAFIQFRAFKLLVVRALLSG